MPSLHETAYPRIKNNLTQEDLEKIYTPKVEEIQWAFKTARGSVPQLGLLILLKTFQHLGYFKSITEVPSNIVQHVARKVGLQIPSEKEWYSYSKTRTCYRHYSFIRKFLGIHFFNEKARQVMIDAMSKVFISKDEPADLINVAIKELIKEKFELPSFNTLVKTARHIRAKSYRLLYFNIYRSLNDEDKQMIDKLFLSEGTTYTAWNHLKEDAKRATISHLRDLITHRDWLTQQNINTTALQDIHITKIKQMAAEARTLDAARMTEMEDKKRYSLAVSLVYVQLSKVLDDIGEMLIKRLMSIHKKGRQRLKEYKEKNQKRADSLISTLHDLLIAYQTEGNSEERIQSIQKVVQDREEQVLRDCESHLAFSGDNYNLFLWQFYKSHRATLFKILKSFPLRSTTQDKVFEEAVSFLLSHQHTRKEWISVVQEEKVGPWKKVVPPLLDLSWVPDAWWRWVGPKKKKEKMPEEINRRHFEVCVFSQIMLELKAGDLYIEGSEKYADYRKQLISWDEYESNVSEFCEQVNLPSSKTNFVKKMQQEFKKVATSTDHSFPHNEQVRIENGEVVIGKLKKKKAPPELKKLENYIADKLEPVNVLGVPPHAHQANTGEWLE